MKTIIFAVAGYNLAETGRHIEIARACKDDFNIVFLSYGGAYMSWWKIGDVKAILRPSATTGVFKGDWYMADKSINSDAYIFFDGTTLKTIVAGEESGYLKMYPTNSNGNSFSTASATFLSSLLIN